jgi:hypothetical protein
LHQGPGGVHDPLLIESRQARGGRQTGTVAEHGDGPGHGHRVRRQPGQPQEHHPGHRPRAHLTDHIDVGRVGRNALGLHGLEQLEQQQWVAAGRPVARRPEGVLGAGAQPLAHQLARGRLAQGARADGDGYRVLCDLG